MPSLLNTLLLASALSTFYIGTVAGLEWARRKFNFSPEITRRVVHVFSGLSTLLDFLLLPGPWFLALIAISLVGIAASQKFGWLTSVHEVRRRTYGEVFLPVGTLSTYAATSGEPRLFIPALLIMTFADAASGITSDLLRLQRKSLRGSAVFFAVATGILLGFATPIWHAVLFAFVLTVVERISKWGSDNLTIPLAAGLLLRLL